VVVVVLAGGALLGGAWLWLRDSSLVAIHRVTVSGASGADSGGIRAALTAAARNMTTLDVRMDQLRTAVAPYPVVKDLRVSTQFPHGIRIRVIEQLPVAAVQIGGRTVPVAADGTLLHDVVASAPLPLIPLRVPPGGTRLTEPGAVQTVALLAAAPYPLLAKISQVTTVSGHGLVAQIRGGPSVYFGGAADLTAKWSAVSALLADSGSAGALYIDVTDPQRPVAGAGTDQTTPAQTAAAAGATESAGSGTPNTAGG
jgi:cell division protein FtsQ